MLYLYNSLPYVVFDNVKIEIWSNTIISVAGQMHMTMCYYGDIPKSRARRLRKLFRKSGFIKQAAAPRLSKPYPTWQLSE